MNKLQTALEWLLEQIGNKNGKEFTSYYAEFIEQAKEMERQQIINAHGRGIVEHSGFPKPLTSEEYFEVTYKNEKE
jgi:hypothetical protein